MARIETEAMRGTRQSILTRTSLYRKAATLAAASAFSILLLWSSALPSWAAGGDEEDWFPLAKGNYWVYRGPTKWVEKGSVKEATLTWRMEITEVLQRGDSLLAAVVRGMPDDLEWYDPGKKPGKYIIVRVGSSSYHKFEDKADGMLKKFRSEAPEPYKLVDEDSVFLETPLVVDKRYGPYSEIARGEYCWRVDSAAPFNADGVKGLDPAPRTAYTVTFWTNPARTTMDVVPGVGIVAYSYLHHGTTSETHLRLVEVHLVKP